MLGCTKQSYPSVGLLGSVLTSGLPTWLCPPGPNLCGLNLYVISLVLLIDCRHLSLPTVLSFLALVM